MVPRQIWLFHLGCWVAIATGALRLVAHVTVAGDVSALLAGLPPRYVFLVPGLRQPTLVSVLDGLSLSVAILMATVGAAGLALLRHVESAPTAIRSLARVFATGVAMLLAVSIADVFSLESFAMALAFMCFGLASVTPEDSHAAPAEVSDTERIWPGAEDHERPER